MNAKGLGSNPYSWHSWPEESFSEKTSVESREISDGVILDYNADATLVGIDIDNASRRVQLNEVSLQKLPANIKAVA
jgi:uncharacterized protein YuzE